MNLSNRLLCVAGFVRDKAKLVDVGTDHAYLPAYLVMSGRVISAIACDIGQGPIDNAKETVERYKLHNAIELRLSDGLRGIEAYEADDICICGMGGELIAQIIKNAEWLKTDSKQLILQPMSAVDDLRIYLADSGFKVINETLVKDSGRIYNVIVAKFCGEKFYYPPEYPMIGNIKCDSDIAAEYLSRQLKRITKHIAMLKNASDKSDIPRLKQIAQLIKIRLDDVQ